MSKTLDTIRLFVSSPSDVADERERVANVVQALNRTVAPRLGLSIRLLSSKGDVVPSFGRPQEVINDQIGEYDIYIGVMWKRFGTPTVNALSGTKEEFDLARERLRARGAPWIMFYFNEAPYTIKTSAEAEQLTAVMRFREELEREALVASYNGADDFKRQIRDHLTEAAFSIQRARALPCKQVTLYSMEIDEDLGSLSEKHSPLEKRACLSHIVSRLSAVHFLAHDEVLERFIEREEMASTALGDDRAIPHISYPGIQTHIVVVAHSKRGVDWQGLDGTPVHLVLLQIHPQYSIADKLRIMARLSNQFRPLGPDGYRSLVARNAVEQLGSPSFKLDTSHSMKRSAGPQLTIRPNVKITDAFVVPLTKPFCQAVLLRSGHAILRDA